jgi:ABC-2 type transport system ATP-binding protein
MKVELLNVALDVGFGRVILRDASIAIESGQFVALLGENGAGKTTLLDLILGFRKPTSGEIRVGGEPHPHLDHWQQRHRIAYLSEKVDIPGDWSVADFFTFHRYFYPSYSREAEAELCARFRVKPEGRLGNMSAGEVRRVQIVGALAAKPELVLIDEITAVLDIVGRRKLLDYLREENRARGLTVILATNIIEDLDRVATHLLLLRQGAVMAFRSISDYCAANGNIAFAECVAQDLERL